MAKYFLSKKNKRIIIPAIFFSIFLICQIDFEPEYISNATQSSKDTLLKLAGVETNYSKFSLPENDYNKLIDINFEFQILPLKCNQSTPVLLILIHSAPANFDKRQAERDTWGRETPFIKTIFILGSVNSDSKANIQIKNKLIEESETFNDILQGSFIDSYKNLTYKHIMALKYAVYHCENAKYILKADDDIVVNTPLLSNYITKNDFFHGVKNLLMCNVWEHARVRRSYRSKYRFSVKEYPEKTFPKYCAGWFIFYSPDVVFRLYNLAQKSNYFWIDDVFITGILAKKININHFSIRSFVASRNLMAKLVKGECNRESMRYLMLGMPNINAKEIRIIWNCFEDMFYNVI